MIKAISALASVGLVFAPQMVLASNNSKTQTAPSISRSSAAISGTRNHGAEDYAPGYSFGPYIAYLSRNFKKHWSPYSVNMLKPVVVLFRIESDGNLSKLQIDKSSGNTATDKLALDAVKATAPCRPLPSWAPHTVDFRFVFDKHFLEPENYHNGRNGSVLK